MKNRMYFISGVSGVGKTVVIPHLKMILPNSFEVHDFDERGVPNNATHEWRLDETRYWIDLGQKKSALGITVLVCGFSNPDEIEPIQKDFPNIETCTILLDGEESITETRLRKRNSNPEVKADLERAVGSAEAFIQNNTKFIGILRCICQKHNCPFVDTSYLDPKSVAEEIKKIILK